MHLLTLVKFTEEMITHAIVDLRTGKGVWARSFPDFNVIGLIPNSKS